jgi:hypothetical protein
MQVTFVKVTSEHLALSIRRRCSIDVANSLLMGVLLTYCASYLPYINLWAFPSLYNFVAVWTFLRSYLMNDLHALAVAGRVLANKFKVSNEEAIFTG